MLQYNLAMRTIWLVAAIAALPAGASTVLAAPKARVAPAAWVAPSVPDTQVTPDLGTRVVAVGEHTAIGALELHPATSTRSSARPSAPKLLAYLAYDPTTGVRGPLKLPSGTTWVGLGANDVVLAATANGTLWSADGVDAALAGRFVPLDRIPGATSWDANAAANIVLATAGHAISISTDGGANFKKVERPRAIEAAFVRADGVLVADPKGAPPEVSGDRGVTWTSAPAEVGSLVVVRNGNWIGERDAEGAVTCRSGALAADGETWVSWELWHAEPAAPGSVVTALFPSDGLAERWNQRLLGSSQLDEQGVAPATNARTDPMPKPVATDLAAYHAHCKPDPNGGALADLLGMLLGNGEPACQGADCVTTEVKHHYDAPLIEVHTFHDATPSRSARAVIVDLRTGRHALLVPPPSCNSVLLRDLGGAAVLGCRATDGVDLQLAGLDGVWHAAGHISGSPDRVDRATDGTIVLTASCRTTARDCFAWVRRAAPLDDGTAFERVDVPGARAFGALPGGKVLVAAVAAARADDRSWVYLRSSSIPADTGAGEPDRPKALTDKLGTLADCFHALGAGRQPGEVALHWSTTGTVIDSGPAELTSCARRVIGTLPATLAPGSNVLYFRVIKHAFDLLELAPGQPAVPIARDLTFDGDLDTIALDARGAITFSAHRSKPYVETRYRVDRATGKATPVPNR